jgi:hypothetical protein
MEASVALFLPKPKPSDPTELPYPSPNRSSPRRPSEPVIPPELFRGLNVFVQSDNPTEQSSVRQALQLAGAVVRESSESVDIVVSPSRVVNAPAPQPRSRGARLVLAAGPPPPAKNVLIRQLPWVPVVLKRHEEAQKAVSVAAPPIAVVADSSRQYAPVYRPLTTIPELHFGDVPRGYSDSPFDPIPTTEVALARIRNRAAHHPVLVNEVPRKGFCEPCQAEYLDAGLHRPSPLHQARAVADLNWVEFDQIATIIGGIG